MSMNDLLNDAKSEIKRLQAVNVELTNQIQLLSKRPEFDVSTAEGCEQVVVKRLHIQIKDDIMVTNHE